MMWMVMILVPVMGNPEAYENSPPATIWLGLFLMIVPLGVWGLTLLYGLYGAARCFGGHNFKYAVIGNWLASQEQTAE